MTQPNRGRYKRSKRAPKRGTRKKGVTKGPLTKPALKQVEAVAKKLDRSGLESKYFSTTQLSDLTRLLPLVPMPTTQPKAFSVRGFAVGTGILGGTSGHIQYGYENGAYTNVEPLNMVRLFNMSDGTLLGQNSLDGSKCSPSLQKSEWYFRYPTTRTENVDTEGYPIMIRFIRVKPKNPKYASVSIVPREDLFLDQYNKSTGVSQNAFNDTDIQMLVVNKRKYTLIEDSSRILYPTTLINTVRSSAGDTATLVADRPYEWRHTCNHKQPKELHYENASIDAGHQPKAGQSNEFIFVHYIALGQSGTSSNGNNVDVSVKCCGTYKDI